MKLWKSKISPIFLQTFSSANISTRKIVYGTNFRLKKLRNSNFVQDGTKEKVSSKIKPHLTLSIWQTRQFLPWSKWKMGEILAFQWWWKAVSKKYFWNSSMRSPWHFHYWICTLDQNFPFLCTSFNSKWQAHGGISKIFLLANFSPSFLGQKC